MRDEIILETERLLFRRHIEADMEAFCAMEQDADVFRYVGGKPRTREEAERRFKNNLKPPTSRLSICATIFKPDAKYIGRCGIYPYVDRNGEPMPGEASLGLYLAKDYWGKGLATEAGKAFVSFGFNELKLKKIVTMVQVGNDASVRVLVKLGFEIVFTEKWENRSFYHFGISNPTQINL